MTLISTLIISSAVITFRGYVPPHAAADGLRYQVVAAAVDIPAAMAACGIDDFSRVRPSGTDTIYQFAVARSGAAGTQCLRQRLPAGARLTAVDHWNTDAQTD